MTSYLFPSSLSPLLVVVIAGQTPAPHVVICRSDKCSQAVITSGRIHWVSIWKPALWRRCHALSCQQGKEKRGGKKEYLIIGILLLPPPVWRRELLPGLGSTQALYWRGNAAAASILTVSEILWGNHGIIVVGKDLWDHPVQPSAYHQCCPLNRVQRFIIRKIIYMIWNLLDLTMTSRRPWIYLEAMDVFTEAREMGSKPDRNITQQNLTKHNVVLITPAAGQPPSPHLVIGQDHVLLLAERGTPGGVKLITADEPGSSHAAFQLRTAVFPRFGGNLGSHHSCR